MRIVPNYQLMEFLNWVAQNGKPQPGELAGLFLERMDEAYPKRSEGWYPRPYSGLADSVLGLLQGSVYKDLMVDDATSLDLIELIKGIGLPAEGLEQVRAEIQRYLKVSYHAVFLFLEKGDFPEFLHNYRNDLHHLSGALLDIYYTPKDLEWRISGYAMIRDFSSIEQAKMIAKLPALLLWGDSLAGASVISLDRLDHNDIFRVMQTIVQSIAECKDLAEISEAAYARAQELANIQLATAHSVVHGGIHYYGRVLGNVNSGSGPQNNFGDQ